MLLNRRHLRIKVLQELYAYYQSEGQDYVLRERELDKSIGKIWDMYILWLSLIVEVTDFAEMRIEENKKKRLPTQSDLKPNLKFVSNKLLKFLGANRQLNKETERLKMSWKDQEEMVKKLYNRIQENELYIEYMASPEQNFEDDRNFVISIFKKEFVNFEPVHHLLEESSIFWLDDIDLVCSMVIKTIKQLKAGDDELTRLPNLFKDNDDEEQYYKTLFRKTILDDKRVSELISSKTDNWELDRIAKMDVILMKMAIIEALEFPTIPLKVSLNEYIEISKFYSTPKSNAFINGILDKAFDELKNQGEIKKVGRGLIE